VTTRALVLAGGGQAGIAWETGVLAGLFDLGVDLVAEADVIIGTSAGASVAAVMTWVTADEACALQLRTDLPNIDVHYDLAERARETAAIEVQARDETERLQLFGRMAVETETAPEAERRRVIEARLPVHEWPERPIRLAAIDAETGALTVFDNGSGVSLVDAVAASCAVPGIYPPTTIDGRRYYDGGLRSTANADLAAGYDEIVVLMPIPLAARMARLDHDVDALRAGGSTVTVIAADDEAVASYIDLLLAPESRPIGLAAGRRQARHAAPRTRERRGSGA
jgi:NTE family protein